ITTRDSDCASTPPSEDRPRIEVSDSASNGSPRIDGSSPPGMESDASSSPPTQPAADNDSVNETSSDLHRTHGTSTSAAMIAAEGPSAVTDALNAVDGVSDYTTAALQNEETANNGRTTNESTEAMILASEHIPPADTQNTLSLDGETVTVSDFDSAKDAHILLGCRQTIRQSARDAGVEILISLCVARLLWQGKDWTKHLGSILKIVPNKKNVKSAFYKIMSNGTNADAPKGVDSDAVEDWPSVVKEEHHFRDNVRNVIAFFHKTFRRRFNVEFSVNAITGNRCFWTETTGSVREPQRKRRRTVQNEAAAATMPSDDDGPDEDGE
ncbi:hypothetical protein HDU96_004315, partial [Phlyctochytrium bullatum]